MIGKLTLLFMLIWPLQGWSTGKCELWGAGHQLLGREVESGLLATAEVWADEHANSVEVTIRYYGGMRTAWFANMKVGHMAGNTAGNQLLIGKESIWIQIENHEYIFEFLRNSE